MSGYGLGICRLRVFPGSTLALAVHLVYNTNKVHKAMKGDAMNETSTITARISAQSKERLEALAQATGRTKGFLVAQAVEEYLEAQAWQIEETMKAIEEADAGDFATDEESGAFRAKWA